MHTTIFRHSLVRSSWAVFMGAFAVGALNYVFTFVMGRMLGPVKFGEIATLFGLLVIIGVPSAALTMYMARYSSLYKSKSDYNSINHMLSFLTRYIGLVGAAFLILFLIFTPILSKFFNISYGPLLIFSILIPISLISSLNLGVLQGLQEFFVFSYSGIIGASLKLIIAVSLVMLGLAVPGVMIALIFAATVSYLYALSKVQSKIGSLDTVENIGRPQIEWKHIYPHFSIVFLATLFLAFLSNMDIILAKHYLAGDIAGQYAALSVIGKILIYGVSALTTIMFPMASEAHFDGNGKDRKILHGSLAIISLVYAFLIAVFLAAPKLVVHVFFGEQYLRIGGYLGWFGLAMYFVAVATLFINYFVAIHNRSFIYPFALSILLEIGLIVIYHRDIGQITYSLIGSSLALTLLMAANYYFLPRKTV